MKLRRHRFPPPTAKFFLRKRWAEIFLASSAYPLAIATGKTTSAGHELQNLGDREVAIACGTTQDGDAATSGTNISHDTIDQRLQFN